MLRSQRVKKLMSANVQSLQSYPCKVLNISHDHRFNYSEEKKRVYDKGHKTKRQTNRVTYVLLESANFQLPHLLNLLCISMYINMVTQLIYRQLSRHNHQECKQPITHQCKQLIPSQSNQLTHFQFRQPIHPRHCPPSPASRLCKQSLTAYKCKVSLLITEVYLSRKYLVRANMNLKIVNQELCAY